MTDFKGTEINIGDRVAVALCGGTRATFMEERKVVGFCKRGAYNCLILERTDDKCWYKTIVRAKHKVAKIS